MHRFFVPAEQLNASDIVLPEGVSQQIARVLRLRPGAHVGLFCGDGHECTAVLQEVAGRTVTARIVDRRQPDVELRSELHVALAVLKGEKLDWTIQKLTELGASRITLLQTERSIVSAGDERWSKRLPRYMRIAREAAEQCGRVRVPVIDGPAEMAALLQGTLTTATWYLLTPLESELLSVRLEACSDAVGLLVGPEGGFTQGELETAGAAGAVPAGLGRRVLRAETAAIAAAALAAARLESA